jgi:hypothetical protein
LQPVRGRQTDHHRTRFASHVLPHLVYDNLSVDFGQGGATVFIGNQECTNTTHLADAYHQLTCVLPSGNLLYRPVLVLQANGLLSTSPSALSYRQCPFGTFEDGLFCRNCSGTVFTALLSCVI